MGLRAQAASDLQGITEDAAAGFGWPIRITPPGGVETSVVGLSNDIATTIDPETGQAVNARNASVAISLKTLEAAGLEMPKGVADGSAKPWVVSFNDITGVEHFFKVQEALPDRAAGIVVCLLEAYTPPSSDS